MKATHIGELSCLLDFRNSMEAYYEGDLPPKIQDALVTLEDSLPRYDCQCIILECTGAEAHAAIWKDKILFKYGSSIVNSNPVGESKGT